MNKKVDELVRRVRLTEKDADKAIHETYADFPVWYRVAQAQLNKVLNDPDLALIDREKLKAQIKLLADPKLKRQNYPSIADCIIPLAEALKGE